MTTQMHVHTHARRQAVQILYQHELTGCSLEKLVGADPKNAGQHDGEHHADPKGSGSVAGKVACGDATHKDGEHHTSSKNAKKAKSGKDAKSVEDAKNAAEISAFAISTYPEGVDDNDLTGNPLSDYACSLIMGVADKLEKIDADIIKTAENWTLERMPVVDRNIIRVAVYEVVYAENIPTGVAINEAVEMAKLYGSADSPKFVNGILGRIATLYDAGADKSAADDKDAATDKDAVDDKGAANDNDADKGDTNNDAPKDNTQEQGNK